MKQKKIYSIPEVDILFVNTVDIMRASGLSDTPPPPTSSAPERKKAF